MAKKFYAVKKGHTIGIFDNWEDTKKATHGYPNAVYKSFKTSVEADAFMSVKDDETNVEEPVNVDVINNDVETKIRNLRENEAVIFVDGTFSADKTRYGYGSIILTKGGYEESFYKSGNDKEFLSSHNVAGEILAVIDSLEFCLENNIINVSLYYDYTGIENWGNGNWKARSPISKKYVRFLREVAKDIKIEFIKVPAHAGVDYNEKADKLASYSLLKKGHRTHKDGSVLINGKTEKDLNDVIEEFKSHVDENIKFEVSDSNDYRKIMKLFYKDQKVTVSIYNKNNTIYIQGKDSNLFKNLLSLFLETTDKDETREVLNRYYGADVREEDVTLEFNNYLPDFNFKENDLAHFNNLQCSVYNVMFTGYRPDYSFLVYPVFRSFEFIFHRILNDYMQVETEGKNGSNTFSHQFRKDKNGIYTCKSKEKSKLSGTQLDYLEDLYNYYSKNRHNLSHWSKDSADTQMLPDINNAKSIIKTGLDKINKYYINF